MSVKAKLIIDDKEINILWFSFSFYQGSDISGKPSQRPVFVSLNVIIEAQKDLNLADWSFNSNQTKQLELHIYPVILGGRTRKIYFYDCHLVGWKNDFSSIGSEPMSEKLEITAAGVEDSTSEGIYSAHWRKTFKEDNVKVTTQEKDLTPAVTDWYLTDENNNKIDKADYEDIVYLLIKTKNLIGEKITVNLDNPKVDFIYRNELLINDTLRDYEISSNTEKVKLKVIKQEKK